jgi:hypothetical protein
MKKVYFLLFAFVGLLNSCGLYRQNVVNVPLFQHKGEVQIGGHASGTGYDGQVAVAVTNSMGLIGNLHFTNKNSSFSNTNYTKMNHAFYEVGVGHFRKNKQDFIHEYFLVFGQGNTSMQNATGNGVIQNYDVRSAKYARWLLQADFGKVKNQVEYVLTPRVFWINYFDHVDTQDLSYLTIPHAFIWSDLAFSVRYAPMRFVKIMGQVSMTLPITGSKYGYYEASPLNASIGLVFNVR